MLKHSKGLIIKALKKLLCKERLKVVLCKNCFTVNVNVNVNHQRGKSSKLV